MKKIYLKKYGFIRAPEEDFTDDSAVFTCYRAGKVLVSKTLYNDKVYLSGHANIDGKLPYEVYSNLPYYASLNRLNGVTVVGLEGADLEKLYSDCLAYEKEYEAACAEIKYPTLAEIEKKSDEIWIKHHIEYDDIRQRIRDDPAILVELYNKFKYKFDCFMRSFSCLHAEVFNPRPDVSYMANTAMSIDYINSPVSESWHHKYCLECLSKI